MMKTKTSVCECCGATLGDGVDLVALLEHGHFGDVTKKAAEKAHGLLSRYGVVCKVDKDSTAYPHQDTRYSQACEGKNHFAIRVVLSEDRRSLVAAAPELLEALRGVLNVFRVCVGNDVFEGFVLGNNGVIAAHQAIAKAEGRSGTKRRRV